MKLAWVFWPSSSLDGIHYKYSFGFVGCTEELRKRASGRFNRDNASMLSFSILVKSPDNPTIHKAFVPPFITYCVLGTALGPWHAILTTTETVLKLIAAIFWVWDLPNKKMLSIGTSTISGTVCFGRKEYNKQQTNLNTDLDQKMHPK